MFPSNAISGDLKKVNNFNQLTENLLVHDWNDDGVFSREEVSRIEIEANDSNKNGVMEIWEMMEAVNKERRQEVFSRAAREFLKTLLSDPQIEYYTKKYGNYAVTELLKILDNQSKIRLDFRQAKEELVKIIKTVEEILEYCHKNIQGTLFADLIKVIYALNEQGISLEKVLPFISKPQMKVLVKTMPYITFLKSKGLDIDFHKCLTENDLVEEFSCKINIFIEGFITGKNKELNKGRGGYIYGEGTQEVCDFVLAMYKISPELTKAVIMRLALSATYFLVSNLSSFGGRLDPENNDYFLVLYESLKKRSGSFLSKLKEIDPDNRATTGFFVSLEKAHKLINFAEGQPEGVDHFVEIAKAAKQKQEKFMKEFFRSMENFSSSAIFNDIKKTFRGVRKYYLNDQTFNPQLAWDCLQHIARNKHNLKIAKEFTAESFFYFGALALYALPKPEFAVKQFERAVEIIPELQNRFPYLYFLLQMRGARFVREHILLLENDQNFWAVGLNKDYYKIREYVLSSGQRISLVFNKKGKLQTLVPGRIFEEGEGRIASIYRSRTKSQRISFRVSYPSPKYLLYNNEVLNALNVLPAYFFERLNNVVIVQGYKRSWFGRVVAGMYSPGSVFWGEQKLWISAEEKIETFSHELFHHYDFFLLTEREREIFRQISWKHGDVFFVPRDRDQRDFSGGCEVGLFLQDRITSFNGEETVVCPIFEFKQTIPYGMKNPYEDFATAGEEYYNHGKEFRKYVEEQMNKGNFELMVKYLFFKYIIFHRVEFGLEDSILEKMEKGVAIERIRMEMQEH